MGNGAFTPLKGLIYLPEYCNVLGGLISCVYVGLGDVVGSVLNCFGALV
jgi:hypothetical protein